MIFGAERFEVSVAKGRATLRSSHLGRIPVSGRLTEVESLLRSRSSHLRVHWTATAAENESDDGDDAQGLRHWTKLGNDLWLSAGLAQDDECLQPEVWLWESGGLAVCSNRAMLGNAKAFETLKIRSLCRRPRAVICPKACIWRSMIRHELRKSLLA